jgi:hypothetical protein
MKLRRLTLALSFLLLICLPVRAADVDLLMGNPSQASPDPSQKNNFLMTMVRTKSGGDSTVRPEFGIRGRLFHPTRLKGERLDEYIEQAFIKLALFPARHRADQW